MITSPPTPLVSTPTVAARRGGYVVAIAINLVMLYVANHLLAWDLLPFLTADFERVLLLINISLVATILVNAVYLGYDQGWFRSLGQVGLNLISLVVGIRMYQVFPFDFSAYEFSWATVVRVMIVLGIVGLAIGTVAELVKLARRGFLVLQ